MPSRRSPARQTALPWERAIRQQLKAALGRGYSLRQQSGFAQLSVRFNDGTRTSTNLRVRWEPLQAPTIVAAAIAAGQRVAGGESLPRGPRLSALLDSGTPDWGVVSARWRDHRCRVLADLSDKSWAHHYSPVMALLAAARPRDAREAMLACATGEPGSRGRQMRLRICHTALQWAVREGLAGERWAPPPVADYAGRRAAAPQPVGHMPDDAIVRLLGGLDGDLWLAVAALACLGLRPWELRHLQVLDDGTVRVCQGKTHSRGRTQPRVVVPLAPVGAPAGLVAAVLAGVRAGGLPNLGADDSRVSTRLTNRLRRRPAWGGYPLYSLRKSYGYRASVVHGLPLRHVAALMGHSVAVAHRYYGSTDAADAVAAAKGLDKSAVRV